MGSALLRGWQQQQLGTITIIEPKQPADLGKAQWIASAADLPASYSPSAIILAIKPQMMAAALPSYARFDNSLFLSIAAGKKIETLNHLLGGNKAIIRTMPNLPASIGKGVSVAATNQITSAEQKTLGEKLLRAVGSFAWVDDENLLDAVTALSGSGPAYVFALVEAMASAGEKLGLTTHLAEQLARATLIGSTALLEQSSHNASELRQMVTSPGGTTAAALEQLLAPANGLHNILAQTLAAAARRARELAD